MPDALAVDTPTLANQTPLSDAQPSSVSGKHTQQNSAEPSTNSSEPSRSPEGTSSGERLSYSKSDTAGSRHSRKCANTTEAAVLNAVLAELGAEPDFIIWRVTVGLFESHGRTVRVGIPGQSDLFGILAPTGRLICLEVKNASGRESTEQKNWGRIIAEHGGFYAVVRSTTDARNALNRARNGESQ